MLEPLVHLLLEATLQDGVQGARPALDRLRVAGVDGVRNQLGLPKLTVDADDIPEAEEQSAGGFPVLVCLELVAFTDAKVLLDEGETVPLRECTNLLSLELVETSVQAGILSFGELVK